MVKTQASKVLNSIASFTPLKGGSRNQVSEGVRQKNYREEFSNLKFIRNKVILG